MDIKAAEAVLGSIPANRKVSMFKAMRGLNDPPFPPLQKKKPETIRVELVDPLEKQWFLCGPFVGSQVEIVAKLPGRALIVWLLVHHQCRMRQTEEITLPTTLLERVGVKQMAKLRALRCLEKAGLIIVAWQSGHSPRIRLKGA